jgi:HEAT repeat protein
VSAALDRDDLAGAIAAYDRLRASDGDDVGVLVRIAERLLETEARSDDADRRTAALSQLVLAGTEGHAALERIAQEGSTPALAILAEAGDLVARATLRDRIDSADADVRAAAVLGLSIESDREQLLALAAEPSAHVRAAAVERLAELAPESAARGVLEERARMDPDPLVRGAAVRALGSFGTAASPILRERLSDPIGSVRMAAVAAILRADRQSGRQTIAALLAAPPSVQGIEGARLLATPSGHDAPTEADMSAATAYLIAALAASEPSLRSQCAVAAATLRSPTIAPALSTALGRETDGTAKLAIARALLSLPGGEADALAAIRALSSADASMIALQASIVLATRHDEDGVRRVETAMRSADIPLRRAAARALARDAMLPGRAAPALDDPDALVRIQAAGGILAAVAHDG